MSDGLGLVMSGYSKSAAKEAEGRRSQLRDPLGKRILELLLRSTDVGVVHGAEQAKYDSHIVRAARKRLLATRWHPSRLTDGTTLVSLPVHLKTTTEVFKNGYGFQYRFEGFERDPTHMELAIMIDLTQATDLTIEQLDDADDVRELLKKVRIFVELHDDKLTHSFSLGSVDRFKREGRLSDDGLDAMRAFLQDKVAPLLAQVEAEPEKYAVEKTYWLAKRGKNGEVAGELLGTHLFNLNEEKIDGPIRLLPPKRDQGVTDNGLEWEGKVTEVTVQSKLVHWNRAALLADMHHSVDGVRDAYKYGDNHLYLYLHAPVIEGERKYLTHWAATEATLLATTTPKGKTVVRKEGDTSARYAPHIACFTKKLRAQLRKRKRKRDEADNGLPDLRSDKQQRKPFREGEKRTRMENLYFKEHGKSLKGYSQLNHEANPDRATGGPDNTWVAITEGWHEALHACVRDLQATKPELFPE